MKTYLNHLVCFGVLSVCFLASAANTIPNRPLENSEKTPVENIMQHISEFSDAELHQIAQKILTDDLPGEEDYAQILLTEALRKNPRNVDVLIDMAHCIDRQRISAPIKLKRKFDTIYQAFLIEPNNPKVRYHFSSLLLELEQKELFEKIYSQTLNEYPHHRETILEKIRIFSKTDPQSALKIADIALENHIDIEEFLPDFLNILKNQNEKKFVLHLKTYAEKYPNRWLWYYLGIEYMKAGANKNAEAAFKKSILLGNHITGKLQLGIFQYRVQNNPESSIKNLQSVIQEMKNRPFISKTFVYLTHVHLACAMMRAKRPETKQELDFVSKYSFENHDYFMSLVAEFTKYGETEMIKNAMKIAIQNDPLFAEPYNVLADILKKENNLLLGHQIYQKFLVIHSQKK